MSPKNVIFNGLSQEEKEIVQSFIFYNLDKTNICDKNLLKTDFSFLNSNFKKYEIMKNKSKDKNLDKLSEMSHDFYHYDKYLFNPIKKLSKNYFNKEFIDNLNNMIIL